MNLIQALIIKRIKKNIAGYEYERYIKKALVRQYHQTGYKKLARLYQKRVNIIDLELYKLKEKLDEKMKKYI